MVCKRLCDGGQTMDSLQGNTGADCADTFSATTGKNIVSFPPSPPFAEDDSGVEVLQLVEKAATRLEKTEEHCEGIESRARALADRAVGLLKSAAERIETLEAECQTCNALMSEANAR